MGFLPLQGLGVDVWDTPGSHGLEAGTEAHSRMRSAVFRAQPSASGVFCSQPGV